LSPQEVAALLDRGVFDNEVLLKEGWVSALKYEDEITDDLKKRTGGKVRIRLVVMLAGSRQWKLTRKGQFMAEWRLWMSRRKYRHLKVCVHLVGSCRKCCIPEVALT
jgi:hypothetical protein